MRKFGIFVVLASVATLIFAPTALARWKGGMGGGWGMGSKYNAMYDVKTVETLSGEVVKVEKVTPVKGMSAGVHLMLKTGKETISVHLGPAWYINNQETMIAEKDMVEVKGSRVTYREKPAIIAAEIKKGDEVLILRDDNGIPAWAGWRRR